MLLTRSLLVLVICAAFFFVAEMQFSLIDTVATLGGNSLRGSTASVITSALSNIVTLAEPSSAAKDAAGANPLGVGSPPSSDPPRAQKESGQNDPKWDALAEEVVEAARHTWQGYEKTAWGRDAVNPISGTGSDWCKMAVMILDSLSTLWLLGMRTEFERARIWIEEQHMPTPGSHGQHSLFETNIRVLGGLLGAYALSGQATFKDTAARLGKNLIQAFDTYNGVPSTEVDVGTGSHSGSSPCLAQVGTLGMEFRYLSEVTNDHKYQAAVDKLQDILFQAADGHGLVPNDFDASSATFRPGEISLGARGDSYYEYLLKQWIQSGRTEDRLKNEWKKAMKEMTERMVQKTRGNLTFLADLRGGHLHERVDPRMQHLGCFVPGMLMLGSRTLPADEVDPYWEVLAAELTETCYQMYVRFPTGLSPEFVNVQMKASSNEISPGFASYNMLRPETAEAIYYMWYFTGQEKYREMNVHIFKSFQKHSRVRYGYTSIQNVEVNPPQLKDEQESFWVAETIKYLYLTFAPKDRLDLDKFVLNTEAHPLPIRTDNQF